MIDPGDIVTDRLDELLRGLASRTPGQQAIIALESGDRSFRWAGAIGETESTGVQVREGTPFFLASIDKLYNATIVMMLSERGMINLEDPITALLPAELTRGIHQINGIDYSDRITVRHLLSHTSGLADWLEDYPQDGSNMIDQVLGEGDIAFTIEEMAARVRNQLKPHFPPQDPSARRPKVRYSDTNYMLLIAIMEAVTGQPLHKIHEDMLYSPLDLRHTYFPGLSEPLDPTPEPMVLRGEGRPLQIPLLLRSIRGIYSTAQDTLSFLRQFMRGSVFQNSATLAMMKRDWHRFGLPLDRAALRLPGWPIEYGLGIMRFQLPRIFTLPNRLPAVLGHTGSTGCWLFFCPEWDLLLSGSVDEATAGAVPYRTVPKILNLFHKTRGS